jgi:hypothetical protein
MFLFIYEKCELLGSNYVNYVLCYSCLMFSFAGASVGCTCSRKMILLPILLLDLKIDISTTKMCLRLLVCSVHAANEISFGV